ncbi:MAG TPA: ATP-binding protein [Tissierellaceae bacterium]|nr:ATP-binding protein [Tissierellaceae bacterium]
MSKDTINLSIPKKAEYISIVRLTASGLANIMSLNIDDIEDIKVCVGEACINSLITKDNKKISVIFEREEEKIIVKISDTLEIIPEDIKEKRDRDLGLLIIKSLMDEVNFTENGIEMIKNIEVDD